MPVFEKTPEGSVPKIAVPVMPADGNQAESLAAEAAGAGADIVELRADAAFREGGKELIPELLEAASRGAKDVPLLFTLRTDREGGLARTEDAEYAEVLLEAAASGFPACVDVEYERSGAVRVVEKLREMGVESIVSKHDFHATPSYDEILGILKDMENMGGDAAKCAFMPVGDDDVSFAEAASAEASGILGIPHMVISMGERGVSSRLSCGVYGSFMTFGCLSGAASAPGQIEAGELRRRLREIRDVREKGGFIFLTGFMGTGKSTAAERLSELLSLPVVEMDAEIEAGCGRTIPEIFEERGEKGFRELETKTLAGLYEREPSIVSCGGGAVLRKENAALMRSLGVNVLLTAEPETLLERLTGESDGRPNIRNRMSADGIRELLASREPYYVSAADCFVKTDGLSPEKVAESIRRRIFPGRCR